MYTLLTKTYCVTSLGDLKWESNSHKSLGAMIFLNVEDILYIYQNLYFIISRDLGFFDDKCICTVYCKNYDTASFSKIATQYASRALKCYLFVNV